MITYILRRAASGVLLILAVSVVTFLIVFSDTQRIVRSLVGERATAEQLAQRTAEMGLDRPLFQQMIDWFANAFTGDFGASWLTSEPVAQVIINRLPITLSLVICSIVVLALISAVLGTFAAVRQGGAADRIIQIGTEILSALPKFWLALMLVIVFAIQFPLFPATGYVSLQNDVIGWATAVTLPVAAVVMGELRVTSMVRGAIADELNKDYIRTLRSRGLPSREVLFKHVLRNAAEPWVSLLSMKIVGIWTGVVVIEAVFALPGIGTLATNAATRGDGPVLMGVVVATVIVIVFVYLIFDLLQAWLNPKARLT
ncbi:ABC transporter permease [Nesterenkonia ebinurensis]|uniref:ABC transporter permease n=1 Tax=Nesterenkonia ebinurensis TaxID=2608252 RepID=UPI00123D3E22|nr:ABC transporter permease [Nesterenkonia ebinurensis]